MIKLTYKVKCPYCSSIDVRNKNTRYTIFSLVLIMTAALAFFRFLGYPGIITTAGIIFYVYYKRSKKYICNSCCFEFKPGKDDYIEEWEDN